MKRFCAAGRACPAVILLLLADLGACGHGATAPSAALPGSPLPEWVVRGSGEFGGPAGPAFYGVGAVWTVEKAYLARAAADNRARAAVARVFETFCATVVGDYLKWLEAQSGDSATIEQHVSLIINTFAAGTLASVQIVDHQALPDGTTYALAALDLSKFVDGLDHMTELDPRSLSFAREHAALTFARLQVPALAAVKGTDGKCHAALTFMEQPKDDSTGNDCRAGTEQPVGPRQLTYACAGGEASASGLGRSPLAGFAQSDYVDLRSEEHLAVGTSCSWSVRTRLSGVLRTGQIEFETIGRAEPRTCAVDCSTHARVTVTIE
jgi:hypothetical protein